MARSDDLENLSDEELIEKYNDVIDEGVALGSRRMSIGPAVMKAGPIKRELRSRDIDPQEAKR